MVDTTISRISRSGSPELGGGDQVIINLAQKGDGKYLWVDSDVDAAKLLELSFQVGCPYVPGYVSQEKTHQK